MKKTLAILAALVLAASASPAKVTVTASLPDFGSIASYIGGDRVDVTAIARASGDPHHVEVLPAYMVRVARADLYLKVGLGLDQWADGIIDGSRNPHLRIVDCSRGIDVLEKPSSRVDASMGDVHPEGNPHYWLDPSNAAVIAQTIHDALIEADPAGGDAYTANLQRFNEELARRLGEWKARAERMANHSLITYHSSWPYFAHGFGFTVVAKVEPVPGIPPTASHLVALVKTIKESAVPVVIQEPYFSDEGPQYLARETGIRIAKLSPSCADVRPSSSFDHFDRIFDGLEGSRP
jgi:ABC-type Zn uptake system ZnuABC Zn-binding protein ZnuA